MASCITSKWGDNYSPQVKLTVNQSSSTGNTATLSWTLQYIAGYKAYTNGNGRSYSVVIDGATVKSGTYDINQKVGTYTIASGSKTVSKSTSSRNVSFSCSFNFDVKWAGSYSGTRSASGSIGISATESHTVSYNANGGSGAPSSQTKWYGTVLTLSSTKPTRTGYSFQGWATSSSGSVAYAAGGQYGLDQNVTLYAVWKANTYTVSYNANGGSGAPGNQTKTYGVTLKLSTTKPTRTNYNFKGWGTSAGSTTVAYASGASYTANASITLYAVWELAYVAPRISNFQVMRANSSGTEMDDGTYLKVKFNWSTDRTVTAVKVQWYNTSSVWADYWTISASGTSGSVEQTTGGNWDTENSYQIRVYVSDSGGTTYSSTATLASMAYVIDFKSGGTGVAFGKVAEYDNTFEVNFDVRLNNGFNSKSQTISSTSDDTTEKWCNERNSVHFYYTSGLLNGQPSTYGHLLNMTNNYEISQIWCDYSNRKLYYRGGNSSGWFGWKQVFTDGTTADTLYLTNWYRSIGSTGWYNNTYGGGIHMKDSTYVRVYNGKGFVVDGNTHLQNALCTVGTHRFTSSWFGMYGSIDDAQSNTNRKGWIGFNGTNNLYITNNAGNIIVFSNTPVIGSVSGDQLVRTANDSLSTHIGFIRKITGSKTYMEVLCNNGAYGIDMWSSDKRLKKNIKDTEVNALEIIKKIRHASFDWIATGNHENIGYIADEVLEIFPDGVYEVGDDKIKHISNTTITPLISKAVQELNDIVNEQQSVIDAQQKEIDDLKSQVRELKELVLAMSKKEE